MPIVSAIFEVYFTCVLWKHKERACLRKHDSGILLSDDGFLALYKIGNVVIAQATSQDYSVD